MNGKTFLATVFAAALIAVGAVAIIDSNKKKVADPDPVEITPAVKQYEDAADYYADILIMTEKGTVLTALPFYLGEELDKRYQENPGIQEKVDEIIWGFCLKSSDLYRNACDLMTQRRDYRDEMFNALSNIVYRQEYYVNEYGSDLVKTKVKDIYRQEAEWVTPVVNQTLYQESRILDWLNSKIK